MKVLQVKNYNDNIARVKRQEALDRWKAKDNGYGYPIKSMFFFQLHDKNGYTTKEREKGYVAFTDNKACFGMSREKAIANFNSI